MKTRRRPAQELRATIDRLPLDVREAVLEGIKTQQRIIAGAHVDGAGGVCPMVAADVRWKRVSKESVKKAQEVARAWDRYADAKGTWHPATKRQLLALTSMLEASILAETAATDMPLSDVIAEHEQAMSRQAAAEVSMAPSFADVPTPTATPTSAPTRVPTPAPAAAPRRPVAEPELAPAAPRPRVQTGERDRTGELRDRHGWSWLRPFRSYDQYEEALMRALSEIERHEAMIDAPAYVDQPVAR